MIEETFDLEDNKENYEFIDKTKETVGAFYMRMENSEYFDESSLFVVKLPVSEHNRLEVIKAKKK